MSELIPVFDVGGVLLDFDAAYLYRKMFDDDAEMAYFLEHVLSRRWWIDTLDHGQPFAEAVGELAALHPKYRDQILAADSRWREMISGAIDGSRVLLEELKSSGQALYAITNFPHEKFYLCREHFPFLTSFDGVVISGEEKVIKPAAEIYQTLLTRYDLEAANCLFIDDSPANVEGALAVGMQAHLFTGPENLRRYLKNRGIL